MQGGVPWNVHSQSSFVYTSLLCNMFDPVPGLGEEISRLETFKCFKVRDLLTNFQLQKDVVWKKS